MLIQKAPIKFIEGFMLNEHAFQNRPNKPIRTAVQLVHRKREGILGGGGKKDLPAELLQVAPIYFDRELSRRYKKIEEYSSQTNAKLQQCLSEFKNKKNDTYWRMIIKELREIIKAST